MIAAIEPRVSAFPHHWAELKMVGISPAYPILKQLHQAILMLWKSSPSSRSQLQKQAVKSSVLSK